MIPTNILLSEECRQIWEQVRVHADEVHQTNAAHTLGGEEVPEQNPHCYYNTSGGILARDWFTDVGVSLLQQFTTCL